MSATTCFRILFFLVFLRCSFGHTHNGDKEKNTLGVEIGREGQVLMRQDNTKKSVAQDRVMEKAITEKNPLSIEKELSPSQYREATEAFARPSKIDDSYFGHQVPRMPDFVERYPWFFAFSFVGLGLAFLIWICVNVNIEDSKDEARRETMRSMRMLAAAGAMRQRMGASFAPRSRPPTADAILAASRAAAAAGKKPSAGDQNYSPLMAPAPKAKASRPGTTEKTMAALSNAVNNLTGMLSGESSERKFTSSSDTLTNQSAVSKENSKSKHPAVAEGPVIRSGTVLRVATSDIIFASVSSWAEIGEVTAGQQVVAAGPPEMIDTKDGVYTMLPIKPRGAVDLKMLEVLREYWQ